MNASVSAKPLPVRKLNRPFTELGRDQWVVEDDPIFSHFLATISAVFPDVEDFFVATVKANRAAIPAGSPLLQQLKGFMGQEAMHAHQHRALNAQLATLGYDTEYVTKGLAPLTAWLLALKPALLPLSVTASCEHITVVFAKAVLGDETTRNTLLANPDVAALGCWHAVEELEHKHVAFDVFVHANGSYAVRVLGMVVVVTVVGGYFSKCWIHAVYKDRAHLTLSRCRRFFHNLRHQLLLSPWAARQVLEYFRRDFHPDDMDTDALMTEWARRLADETTVMGGAIRG